jgi:hypothetical protein
LTFIFQAEESFLLLEWLESTCKNVSMICEQDQVDTTRNHIVEDVRRVIEDISEQITEINVDVKGQIRQLTLWLKPILTFLREKKIEGLVSGLKQYLPEGAEVKKSGPTTSAASTTGHNPASGTQITQVSQNTSVTLNASLSATSQAATSAPSAATTSTSTSALIPTLTSTSNVDQSTEKKPSAKSIQNSFSSADDVTLISTLRFLHVQCNKETCAVMIGENVLTMIIAILTKTKSFFEHLQLPTTFSQTKDSASTTKFSFELKRERENLEVTLSALKLLYSILRVLRQSEPEFKNTSLLQILLSLKSTITNNYLLYTSATLCLNCHSVNTNISMVIDKYVTMIVNLMINSNWWNLLPTLLEWTYFSPQNQVAGLTLFHDIIPVSLPLHVNQKYYSVNTSDPYLLEILEKTTRRTRYFGVTQQRDAIEKYIFEQRQMWIKNLTENSAIEEKFDTFVTSFCFSSSKLIFTKFVMTLHKLIDLGGIISLRVVEDVLRVVETEISFLVEKAQQRDQEQQRLTAELPSKKKEIKSKPLLCRLLFLLWTISYHPLGKLALIEKNALNVIVPLLGSPTIMSSAAMRKPVTLAMKLIHSLLSPKMISFEKVSSFFQDFSPDALNSARSEDVDKKIIGNLPPVSQLKATIRILFNVVAMLIDEQITGTALLILINLATCFYGAYYILLSDDNDDDDDRMSSSQQLNLLEKETNLSTIPSLQQQHQQQKWNTAKNITGEYSSNKFSNRILFDKFIEKIRSLISEKEEKMNKNSLWCLVELAIHFLMVLQKVVSERFEAKDCSLFKTFVLGKEASRTGDAVFSDQSCEKQYSTTSLHSLMQTLKGIGDERAVLLTDRLQTLINNSLSVLTLDAHKQQSTDVNLDKPFRVVFPKVERTILERLSAIENRIVISRQASPEYFRLSTLCILNDEKDAKYFHTSYVAVDSTYFGFKSDGNSSNKSMVSVDNVEQKNDKKRQNEANAHACKERLSLEKTKYEPSTVCPC